MGVIDRMAAFMGFERRSDANPLDPSWQALGNSTGYFSSVSARAAENLSTVLACTTAVASALAYVPALSRSPPHGECRLSRDVGLVSGEAPQALSESLNANRFG